jgi:hypothetical protein
MSSCFLVSASTPTGNNRHIELAGMELFVYPAQIKIKQALSQTLSIWPILAGRILFKCMIIKF